MLGEDLDARLVWLARQSGYRGMTSGELAVRTASAPKTVQRALDVLSSKGQVLLVDRERRLYVAGETFTALQARALALLQSFHDRAPLEDALHREELRQRLSPDLDPRLLGRLLQALIERGAVESIGEGLRLKGRGRSLSLDEEAARTKAVAAIGAGALAPPTLAEIGRMLSLPVERVSGLLQGPISDHTVVKVSEELCFHGSVLAELKQRLVAHLTGLREITTQQFKELVGGSRKFVIPLSEYFDREKVTLRVGDKRLLRRS
jgi:selenocysteine-specific elongation factor